MAFISRTLQNSELYYPSVEKEATAIIEAVRKWRYLLAGRHFTLVADHQLRDMNHIETKHFYIPPVK